MNFSANFLRENTSAMNSSIVMIVFNEFAATIIEKFEMKTTPEALYKIWHEKVKQMKITVEFNDKPAVSVVSDSDEPEVEVVKVKKAPAKESKEKPVVAKKSSSATCPYKSVRGDNKGQVCGKNVTKDCNMCSAHKKHADKYIKPSDDESEDEPAVAQVAATKGKKSCTYTLSRGDRRGQPCGSGVVVGTEYCAKHSDKKEKKAETVPKAKGAEPSADSAPEQISAKKDASGRIVLRELPLVLKSATERVVIGKVVDDKTVPLNAQDIEFCKTKRLRFEATLSKKSIEDVIDEITTAGEDEDEEDVEHDDELVENEEELLEEEDDDDA